MSTQVQVISERAGIPFSIHDGRRIVETALENVSTPRNWIQKVKGRKVRGEDAPYSKPAIEQLRHKYREALPELEFILTEEAELRQATEIDSLREQVQQMSLTLDIIKSVLPEEQFQKMQWEKMNRDYPPPKVLSPIRMADYEKSKEKAQEE